MRAQLIRPTCHEHSRRVHTPLLSHVEQQALVWLDIVELASADNAKERCPLGSDELEKGLHARRRVACHERDRHLLCVRVYAHGECAHVVRACVSIR
eukprot:366253-Chlamydomonas_euryale.AAC.10